jgi:hypothetical protein
MSDSTFRIIVVILLGVFVFWFVKTQVRLIKNLEAQSCPTLDVEPSESEHAKGELPQTDSIGFKYESNSTLEQSQSIRQPPNIFSRK